MSCGNGIAGYKGKPYISKDGGLTYLIISESKDMSISKNMSAIDTTSFDSIDGWKTFIEGLKEWTVSVESIYVPADPGQVDVLDGITEGSTLIFQYRPYNVSGQKYFEGAVLVTEWTLSNALEDAITISGAFQGCGKPETKTLP